MGKFRAKQMDDAEWLAFEQAYEMVFQMLGGTKDAALFCARAGASEDSLVLIFLGEEKPTKLAHCLCLLCP